MTEFNYQESYYTYFKFGVVSPHGLPDYCDLIQSLGCEIVSISPGFVPAPGGGIIQGNGRPQVIEVAMVFARCLRGSYDAIMQEMERIAAGEKVKGLRG